MTWQRPMRLYLDTPVLNFAISEQDVAKEKEVTLILLDQIRAGKFEASISEGVLREIKKAPENKAKDLLGLIQSMPLENLIITSDVEALADKYIEEKIIPLKYREDALHIAMASVYGLDVIVSWNFEHMVKVKTRREVQGTNTMMGYRSIDIATPEEVIDYD